MAHIHGQNYVYTTSVHGKYFRWVEYSGCVAGIVPWVVLSFYAFSDGGTGDTSALRFVYGIIFTNFSALGRAHMRLL